MCTEIFRNKFVWKKDSCEVAAIDQPIMQCVQPVSLMIPFSLFLGVDLLSQYGLKYLVEMNNFALTILLLQGKKMLL